MLFAILGAAAVAGLIGLRIYQTGQRFKEDVEARKAIDEAMNGVKSMSEKSE